MFSGIRGLKNTNLISFIDIKEFGLYNIDHVNCIILLKYKINGQNFLEFKKVEFKGKLKNRNELK